MRTLKIQNGRQGAQKWPTGSGKGSTPRFLVPSTPSIRKVDDGEKKKEKRKKRKKRKEWRF